MKISVKVKPNAKKIGIKKIDETHFEIKVKERPKGGRANTAVMEAMAKYFYVPISRVKIIHGHTNRHKILDVYKKGAEIAKFDLFKPL